MHDIHELPYTRIAASGTRNHDVYWGHNYFDRDLPRQIQRKVSCSWPDQSLSGTLYTVSKVAKVQPLG